MGKRLRVRQHAPHVLEAHPWQRQQVVDDRDLYLADDRQLPLDEQIVIAVNGSADRVLDRDDAEVHRPVADGIEHLVERGVWARLRIRHQPEHGGLAERARFTLIRDSHADLVAPKTKGRRLSFE